MLYRRTINGDYDFGKSLQSFVSGVDAVSQAIKTRLLLLLGEWWEDMSIGLPLFQNILGQSGTQQHLDSADLLVQENILGTAGVLSIESFNSSYQSRKYSVSCVVATIYGTANLEVTL